MSIYVVRPGLMATIQDLGRYRFQKYGVVASGAMDTGAARAANLLVGNGDHEAVLEITLTGTELLIETDTLLSICGADMSVTANGERLPLWRPVLVRGGVSVKFGACGSGCRSYLAVAGGFDVPEVMGSKSTYLRGAIGGFKGRALRSGDVLAARTPGRLSERITHFLGKDMNGSFAVPGWHASHFAIAGNLADPIIRAMPGSHYERFTAESQERLFSQTFQIAVQSDRMGYRLEGSHKLMLASPFELLSEAVVNGTVQVPPGGDPIVLLADRQTTGGYPRVAQVASVDIPVFAQLKPGDRFRFEAITQHEAEQLYLDNERDLKMLEAAITLKFNSAN
ncbi:MAG TPA: biotin-dependent carboxyltransferase family protein [Candidatus Udaeobacter sp.]|nr:biotin-dependent carboxyltransferase family protein [Candidatus Udaeobacter sp.]